MKNACIVGYGAVGPVHAYALSQTENANVYAVCDIDKKRAKKCSDEYNCKMYYDFDKMLEDENIDVVHICTPHYLHKDMVVKSLKAGKYVVLEKPVALNKSELDEIIDFVNKNNAQNKVCVVLQNRTNNAIVKLKEIADNEKTGKLLGIIGMMNWHRDESYYKQDEWRGKKSTEGGGVMINQAVHLLDMMLFFGGKVKSINTSINHWKIKNIEVEDISQALIEFENGATGIFQATNCYVCDEPYYIDIKFENIHLRYADGMLYQITKDGCNVIAKDELVKVGKSYWGNGHCNVINSYYSYLNTGIKRFSNICDAFDTMDLLYKFYE